MDYYHLFKLGLVKQTWASGPLELLAHARSHLDYASPFDRRIAYVSIDNAVELTLRTYLSLPRRFFRPHDPPVAIDENADFKDLLQAVFNHARAKLVGVKRAELSKFHELRNVIYHRSVGSDVDPRFLMSYGEAANGLLEALFGVRLQDDSEALAAFRQELFNALEVEWRAAQRAKHSGRITTRMEKLKEEGRVFGRRSKAISPDELALARRLNTELHWGSVTIAGAINNRREVHLILDRKARLDASITGTLIRQRLRATGGYHAGKPPGKAPRTIPEGFA